MPAAANRSKTLSVNQQRVYQTLTASIRPLTAYEVIDRVNTEDVWAPPTVYRALNTLIELGLIHRIESRKAFLACTCPHQADTSAIFVVCDNCGITKELLDDEVSARLKRCADENKFRIARTTLELRGLCQQCAV